MAHYEYARAHPLWETAKNGCSAGQRCDRGHACRSRLDHRPSQARPRHTLGDDAVTQDPVSPRRTSALGAAVVCHSFGMRRSTPSSTAQNVALVRSHLTWLGVLDDRFAEGMLRPRWALLEKGMRWGPARRMGRNRTFAWLAARTHFFDDAVTSALAAGVRQVVVMAAGYDSRAWRLAHAGVRFYEVDHPATQRDKRRRAPAGGPAYVPVEFGRDSLEDALRLAGFRPDEPSVFTIEGVTMYLTEPQVRDLLETVRRLSAPASRLAVNYGLGVEAAATRTSRVGALLARVQFAMSGERITYRPAVAQAEALLRDTGWCPQETRTAPDLVREYVAGTTLPTTDIRPSAFAVNAVVS